MVFVDHISTTDSTTYYYVVTAVNEAGTSEYSNEATVQAIPEPIQNQSQNQNHSKNTPNETYLYQLNIGQVTGSIKRRERSLLRNIMQAQGRLSQANILLFVLGPIINSQAIRTLPKWF